VEYIFKEVYSSLGPKFTHGIQVFKEIKSFNHYKPIQSPSDNKGDVTPPTVVTPYVYQYFSYIEFGELLSLIAPKKGCRNPDLKDRSLGEISLTEPFDLVSIFISRGDEHSINIELRSPRRSEHYRITDTIKPGDTISTPPDGSSISKWKSEIPKGALKE
jgi:hypothetical protein